MYHSEAILVAQAADVSVTETMSAERCCEGLIQVTSKKKDVAVLRRKSRPRGAPKKGQKIATMRPGRSENAWNHKKKTTKKTNDEARGQA